MLHHILAFFSDLILFTAGILVCLFWLGVIGAIAIESWDFFIGDRKKDDIEEEMYE
jgi:hypothetical protein